MDLKFLINKFKSTDMSKFKATAKKIAEMTGRTYPGVFLDILICTLKYGSGPVDYDYFKMYEMNSVDRAKILTIGKNNDLVRSLNQAEYRDYFENKAMFNEKFNDFLKRDWMVLNGTNGEEFATFVKDKGGAIIKPLDQSCGKGIQKVIYEEGVDFVEVAAKLYEAKCILVEEIVKQCAEMDLLCDTAVNTIRLVTLLNPPDEVYVAAGGIRMGRFGNYVDNFNHGGMAVIMDVEQGVSVTDGYDKDRIFYKEVEATGTVLKGFRPPQWEECKQLVRDAAKVVPEVRYVAWDVAVSQDKGPLLIEGNSYPGQDVVQYPEMGLGTYEAFMKMIT